MTDQTIIYGYQNTQMELSGAWVLMPVEFTLEGLLQELRDCGHNCLEGVSLYTTAKERDREIALHWETHLTDYDN
jgi:hypothetical protein